MCILADGILKKYIWLYLLVYGGEEVVAGRFLFDGY